MLSAGFAEPREADPGACLGEVLVDVGYLGVPEPCRRRRRRVDGDVRADGYVGGVIDVVDVGVRGRSDAASRRRAESERPRRALAATPAGAIDWDLA
jgi:hypothetical protein